MNENWQQIYDDDLLLCETKPEINNLHEKTDINQKKSLKILAFFSP